MSSQKPSPTRVSRQGAFQEARLNRALAAARRAAAAGRAAWPDVQAGAARGWRATERFAKSLVANPYFENVIIALILMNAVVIGLETSPSFVADYGGIAYGVDRLLLAIFAAEIACRIIAERGAYLRTAWAWFDIIVLLIAFAPQAAGLQVLRSFRIFRMLRLMSMVPKMRRVIGGFFMALPGMAGVIGVLAVIFYVSAVITTMAFGQITLAEAAPGATAEDVAMVRALFGDLGSSFFTLFQLMTLENWVDGVVSPTMKVAPNSLWFFLAYIILTSFAVLNLFIGIIVDAMQDEKDLEDREALAEATAGSDARLDALIDEVRRLRTEVAELRRSGDAGS